MIPFNRPHYGPKTIDYLKESIKSNHIQGDGVFTQKVQNFFEEKFDFKYNLTTTSCTDALELISLVLGVDSRDEIILPSYTFVSTANPFLLRGARLVFADSKADSPNIDLDHVKSLITKQTKAIIVVHYAGIAVDINQLLQIKKTYPDISIIEDAAQCINSYYKKTHLGKIGDFSAFSFHETKNLSCGEGGLFVCKTEENFLKAEIIREKGTNRKSFIRGEVDKYGRKNKGSSFLQSDILSAILFSQLQNLELIQKRRDFIWLRYYMAFKELNDKNLVELPIFNSNNKHNSHIFYIITKSLKIRNNLISFLKMKKIQATFHYSSLHKSKFINYQTNKHDLINANKFSECLIRLPIFHELTDSEVNYIIKSVNLFFKSKV